MTILMTASRPAREIAVRYRVLTRDSKDGAFSPPPGRPTMGVYSWARVRTGRKRVPRVSIFRDFIVFNYIRPLTVNMFTLNEN